MSATAATPQLASQSLADLATDLARGLSFVRHVQRDLVHKAADDQVLLTDAKRVDGDRFLVAASWSADHLLYSPGAGGTGDPMFVIESARQAAIYLCHRFYRIPLEGYPFVLAHLDADITSPGVPNSVSTPLPVVLDISCTRTTDRPHRFGMALEAAVYVDSEWCARVGLRFEVVPARQYAILRSRNRPSLQSRSPGTGIATGAPLPPAAVGRRHNRDVLLASVPGSAKESWQLRMDRTHPVFFDHESDHVPGMVIVEAMRQAAYVAGARLPRPYSDLLSWTPSSFAADFECFGELDAPVTIIVRPASRAGTVGGAALHVTAEQGDRILAAGRLGRP